MVFVKSAVGFLRGFVEKAIVDRKSIAAGGVFSVHEYLELSKCLRKLFQEMHTLFSSKAKQNI